MKYQESATVELKRTLEEDMKAEIIAFLNSYIGGTIYVGVDDDGSIYEFTDKEMDDNQSKIINWIRDEAIYPNCSQFINMSYNEDNILAIQITPGNKKPYYLKSKGLKSSGTYIRYGHNKSQASQEEIARMIIESDGISYEGEISSEQDLTFNSLKDKFLQKNMNFNDFNFITSKFIDKKTSHYTNLAYWVSDQYNVDTKMAVYQGLDRVTFRSKKEFTGSIIKQIDNVLEYFEMCNEVRVIIDGSPMRTEIPSYDFISGREGILNTYCHRDFSRKSNIKIEFFDDRCEILPPGGFYGGLTLDDALSGIQSFRNEYLVKLLFRLGYIENYASGLSRIYNEYAKDEKKPTIYSSLVALKLTLPNRNYEYFSSIHNSDGSLKGPLNSSLKGPLKDLYVLIDNKPGINRKELSKEMKKSISTINKQIIKLVDDGFIKREGSRKSGGYVVIKKLDEK